MKPYYVYIFYIMHLYYIPTAMFINYSPKLCKYGIIVHMHISVKIIATATEY